MQEYTLKESDKNKNSNANSNQAACREQSLLYCVPPGSERYYLKRTSIQRFVDKLSLNEIK